MTARARDLRAGVVLVIGGVLIVLCVLPLVRTARVSDKQDIASACDGVYVALGRELAEELSASRTPPSVAAAAEAAIIAVLRRHRVDRNPRDPHRPAYDREPAIAANACQVSVAAREDGAVIVSQYATSTGPVRTFSIEPGP